MTPFQKKSVTVAIVEEGFIRSWWVILCLIGCLKLYESDTAAKKAQHREFSDQLHRLSLLEEESLEKQKQLLLQINSQSDPRFVELTLMKVLGVVPEGQKKYIFLKNPRT